MSSLYIVATPIGNLEDISLRALRVLKEVDFVICEDTRVTAKLLARYEIKKPVVSYHHHSKLQKINYIIERLEEGENAALVSDAGTPGISDPGGVLVSEILKRNTPPISPPYKGGEREFSPLTEGGVRGGCDSNKVVPIPGPCAAVALASVSGIAMDKFLFMGFPPHKKGRKKFFGKVVESDVPVIFYESCHRILKALAELRGLSSPLTEGGVRGGCDKTPLLTKEGIGGGFQIIVGRELTKMFETIYRGSADEVIKKLESDKKNLKGEFTIIVCDNNTN